MRGAVVAATLLALGSGSACGSADDGSSSTLTVYAASSLTVAFTEIGKTFEDSHPGGTVNFSFAGSSDLVAQLQQGAPADVFASADAANMEKATAGDLVEGAPVDFASNTLQIAVPPGNPASISSFTDLTAPDVQLVVCAPEVPCGAAAQQVAAAAGETLTPVSEEQSVTDVLGKVASGEADAGLVYVSDVLAAGEGVEGIPFPESREAVNTYPIAVLADGASSLAQEFVDEVTGPEGQRVLHDAGFADL